MITTAATVLSNYRGNKNIPGVYQWIINRIPPHDIYYEIFAGSAAIATRLDSTAVKVLNDCDTAVTAALNCNILGNTTVLNLPAVQLLSTLLPGKPTTFVYCDPPYMFSTRGSNRRLYKFEMSDSDHEAFLTMVHTATFNCMISHYSCPLYDKYLNTWTKEQRKVRYRGKTVMECIYYNYSKPAYLQSYAYVGVNCWDRQRLTRKINRLVTKLASLPPLERNAVIARVLEKK